MPQAHHTFRVFVSSTFSDLKAERNALQQRVFPRLRELAVEHGFRFQAIDLRWGVSEEASKDQQAMNICLGEIERCQKISPKPNFLVLLGDRYGWLPPPSQIPVDEFERILAVLNPLERKLLQWEEDGRKLSDEVKMVHWDPKVENYVGEKGWYRRDNNACPEAEYVLQPWEGFSYKAWGEVEKVLHAALIKGAKLAGLSEGALFKYWASATHQEIDAGALRVREAPEHVYCFARKVEGYPEDFNGAAFQQDVRERIQEEHKDRLPSAACESYLAEIYQIDPSSNAREFNDRITSLVEDTLKYSLEREFMEQVQGWLVDFSGKDFLNLNDEDWTPDQEALINQNRLKERLEAHVPGNVHHYRAAWTGRGITNNHIDQLCEDVYQSLSNIILREIETSQQVSPGVDGTSPVRAGDAVNAEVAAHQAFAEERVQFFIGRTEMLKKIAGYLQESQVPDQYIEGTGGGGAKLIHRQEGLRTPLVIVGAGGTGKSALIARAIQETRDAYDGAAIVYRFIGATPGSSDGRALLDSLCREISRYYDAPESDLPIDYKDLVPEFGKRLGLATAARPLILFLDSLDQLSPQQGARNLVWLTGKLPEHVSVVVSTRPGDTLDRLAAIQARQEILDGLSDQEGDRLLTAWLADAGRTLQPAQREEVLEKFKASEGAPLYLKLAFEEARLWPSGDGQPPESLEPGIEGIIEVNMIDRLKDEGNHGKMLVSHVLGYLAASRYGLAEDEIIDLISRDLQVYKWFFDKSYHLPADLVQWAIQYRREENGMPSIQEVAPDADEERAALGWLREIRNPPEQVSDFLKGVLPKPEGPKLPVVLWSRLSFDLVPYLSERASEGSILLAFYHQELKDVSSKEFLKDGEKQYYHEKLADYFLVKADPDGTGEWTGSYPRGLSELPYHQTEAELWDDVYATLTDFRFLEEKAARVGVLESQDEKGALVKTYTGVLQLQEDYERALGAMPGGGGAGSWGDRPPLILTAIETSKGLMVYCPVCNQYSPIKNEMLGTVIACPQENCSAGIKLNPFTVKREI